MNSYSEIYRVNFESCGKLNTTMKIVQPSLRTDVECDMQILDKALNFPTFLCYLRLINYTMLNSWRFGHNYKAEISAKTSCAKLVKLSIFAKALLFLKRFFQGFKVLLLSSLLHSYQSISNKFYNCIFFVLFIVTSYIYYIIKEEI